MIPKRVKVGHAVYRVRERPNAEVVNGDGLLCWGTCDYDAKEIDLAEDHKDKRETALHEVIHAIDYNGGYTLEEREVHMLAIGILGVLRDNKGFREWLLE